MKVLVLDTETTGLPASMTEPYTNVENWPRLVSIAWRIYDRTGQLLRKKAFYIEPGEGVVSSPEALAKHGITHEYASEYGINPLYGLSAFAYDACECDIFVAHNAAYDRPIIEAEFFRLSQKGVTTLPIIVAGWICTKEASVQECKIPASEKAKALYPESLYKWPSLDELYQFLFNTTIPGREQFHGASQDAAACAACFWELVRRGVIHL